MSLKAIRGRVDNPRDLLCYYVVILSLLPVVVSSLLLDPALH